LPARDGGYRYANADPVTGQAAWYDLKVKVEKLAEDAAMPRPAAVGRRPGATPPPEVLAYAVKPR
jgi:sulfite dehydrogenase (quinone) subunit SoeA